MDPTWLDLERARANGALPADAYARLVAFTDADPAPATWRRFLDAAALGLGASLLLAGVLYLVAFNWAELGYLTRLSLTAVAFGVAATAGFALAEGKLPRQVALASAGALIGPMLIVYSQAYQTGADPWTLFAAWALLATPWAIVARLGVSWAFIVGLVHVALALGWHQYLGEDDGGHVLAQIGVALAAWLLAATQSTRRSWAYAAASWCFALLGLGTAVAVWDLETAPHAHIALLLLVTAGATQAWCWVRARDLVLVAVSGGALIVASTSGLAQLLEGANLDGVGTTLLLALWLAGSSTALAAWIRVGMTRGAHV